MEITMADNSMQNQVAIVTGAGGGIGSAISRRLAKAGAKIVLLDNKSQDETQAVASSLVGDGHMVVQVSVTDSAACQNLATKVAERYGKANLLVNNAGITNPVAHDDLHGLTDEWIDKIFQVNWRGAFAMIRAFQPLLEKGDGGTVQNLSSVAAITGVGSNVAYCASKAALDSLARSLGRALAPKIRVVSIAPGWVLGEYAKTMDPAYIQMQTDATPLNRLATPEDVAETIWAVHTKLTFLTGSIVPVDGGRLLGT
jgi:3-oxoacyl-[acyl-carrier protein] reductase